jgi:hypothetical protein
MEWWTGQESLLPHQTLTRVCVCVCVCVCVAESGGGWEVGEGVEGGWGQAKKLEFPKQEVQALTAVWESPSQSAPCPICNARDASLTGTTWALGKNSFKQKNKERKGEREEGVNAEHSQKNAECCECSFSIMQITCFWCPKEPGLLFSGSDPCALAFWCLPIPCSSLVRESHSSQVL